jgi:hypothetical protein
MKSLALGALLFCGLAAVLGYVATNGVGMRSTGFSPTVVDNLPTLPQKIGTPPPDVVIEAKPIKEAGAQPPVAVHAKPKPKPALGHAKPKVLTNSNASPAHTVSASHPDPLKQPVVASLSAHPKQTPKPKAVEPRSVRTQSLQIAVEPQPPTDESQDMQRDMEAQREWRARTLERWRQQEREAAASRKSSGTAQPDPSLDNTPVGGLDRAEDDKKTKKKKRHRFLFIRW